MYIKMSIFFLGRSANFLIIHGSQRFINGAVFKISHKKIDRFV